MKRQPRCAPVKEGPSRCATATDLSERPMGLNRRAIRAVYPQIDWDQYDREVGDEARQPYEDALRELVASLDAHDWLRRKQARDKARSFLSDTEASADEEGGPR